MKHFVTGLPKHGDVVRKTDKGTIYIVLGLSRHTETQEACIVYQGLYGDIYHRPLHDFIGYRENGNGNEDFVPRFERLVAKDWENACRAAALTEKQAACPHTYGIVEVGDSIVNCAKCGAQV